MTINLPLENSKWIVNPKDMNNLTPISDNSHCLITMYSESLASEQMDLIRFGHGVNSKLVIQVGGEIEANFASRRPFIHLFFNQSKVNLSLTIVL